MPMLFALGQHAALETAQGRLQPNEIFAYLDDVYVVSTPDRVFEVHQVLEDTLASHNIHVHQGKTQVWNRAGIAPEGVDVLMARARIHNPEVVVWKGDPLLPADLQGVKYVKAFLVRKSEAQRQLFQRIPWVEDTQAAWLLLLMCRSTWANFWLRVVRPELSEGFLPGMMPRCGGVCAKFWALPGHLQSHKSSHPCRCLWVGADSRVRHGCVQRPTGQAGPIVSAW